MGFCSFWASGGNATTRRWAKPGVVTIAAGRVVWAASIQTTSASAVSIFLFGLIGYYYYMFLKFLV